MESTSAFTRSPESGSSASSPASTPHGALTPARTSGKHPSFWSLLKERELCTLNPLLPLALESGESGGVETWWVGCADPETGESIDLRFQLLHSHNGFHRLCESVAVINRRDESRPIAVRQSLPLTEFTQAKGETFEVRFGSNRLSVMGTTGEITSKGQSLSWQLRFSEGPASSTWSLVPAPWTRLPLTVSRDCSWQSPFVIEGFCEWNGKRHEFRGARGFLRHAFAEAMGLEWKRLEAATFVTELGEPCDFHLEAFKIPLATRLGKLFRPRHPLFRFHYQGKDYVTDSLWKSLRSRTSLSGTEWTFQADHDELSFRGTLQSEIRDFTGMTLEDTDGSLTYAVQTRRARCTLRVYRRGKLEASFVSKGPVLFEVADPQRNPYVDLQF